MPATAAGKCTRSRRAGHLQTAGWWQCKRTLSELSSLSTRVAPRACSFRCSCSKRRSGDGPPSALTTADAQQAATAGRPAAHTGMRQLTLATPGKCREPARQPPVLQQAGSLNVHQPDHRICRGGCPPATQRRRSRRQSCTMALPTVLLAALRMTQFPGCRHDMHGGGRRQVVVSYASQIPPLASGAPAGGIAMPTHQRCCPPHAAAPRHHHPRLLAFSSACCSSSR